MMINKFFNKKELIELLVCNITEGASLEQKNMMIEELNNEFNEKKVISQFKKIGFNICRLSDNRYKIKY